MPWDRRRAFMTRGLVIAIVLAGMRPAAAAEISAEIPRVVFLGFELINTSLQPTSAAERARIARLDALFRDRLGGSRRFSLVPVPPAVQRKITEGADISHCNGCERDFATAAGGDWAAWGTVQRVSELILNINLYMEDAATGKMEFVKSVDIRGNTDQSWTRGLDYLLRNYLLQQP